MSRVQKPEPVTLKISNGDTLTVRRRLNAGEQREMLARMSIANPDGSLRLDRFQVGIAKMVAYLIDWSITDDSGEVIPIRGQSAQVVSEALDSLDVDSFSEIREAIEGHMEATETAAAAEKNARDGENKSPKISPSPESVTGDTSGLQS